MIRRALIIEESPLPYCSFIRRDNVRNFIVLPASYPFQVVFIFRNSLPYYVTKIAWELFAEAAVGDPSIKSAHSDPAIAACHALCSGSGASCTLHL